MRNAMIPHTKPTNIMKYDWNVLIVDDEWSERYLLKKHLLSYFSEDHIAECENVEQAVDLIKDSKYNFDLIFSDLFMPGKTGMDFVVDEVLKDDKYKNIPVIITTNALPDSLASQVMKPLVFDYLIKPIEQEMIQKTILKLEQRIVAS